ncbi:sensor histidine kinase [Aquipluma nitroreducens]|uniref:Oxygen sensor histidine kinase NreB n=1 Tax=Aquipluma nitroreducens TaxID=2010828 RepID=A0A5K7S5M2_9BACT|nr:tetratricopeptide repeat protein [Aquipluma nitroreducens]BBE16826.1 sensor histidine kinase [Aquipluma nitroreducens]
MKVIITFTFILFIFTFSNPVSGETGMRIQEILNAKADSNKVKQLSDLCWNYRFKSADSALIFGQQALQLASQINYSKGIAQAYNDMAIIYIDKANFRSATNYLNEAMKIREQLKDSLGIAAIYNKLGIIAQKQGRLKDALQNQIEALKIYQNLKLNKYVGYTLNNIAIIHQNLGNNEKALEYHQRALEYRISLKDQEGEATSYGNMANLYARMHDTIQAINYYEKALALSRELKKDELICANLSNIGNIYMARKDYSKALGLFNESLQIKEKIGDAKGISSTLSRIGTVYTETGRFKDASVALNHSLKMAKSAVVLEEELSALLGLAKLKALTHETDSSFVLMRQYIVLKDSVYDNRLKQQILDVQTQYETDKLEQDLYLIKKDKEFTEVKLQQRKTELWLLIFVMISITGAAIFLFYRHQQRQKAAANAERIQEQEARINAVFQAQEEERRRIAKELHDGVGQTISAIKMNYQSLSGKAAEKELAPEFEKIGKMLENAGTEVRNISHQMIPKELEQFGLIPAIEGMLNLHLGNSPLKVEFEHSGFVERIGQHVELVLFRVLQELISNVIKHSQARQVSVQLIKLNTHVVMNVTDDGIGFDAESKEKGGIGLLNMASRIDAIKGHLHFESEQGKGTTVTIRTPIA